MVRRPAPSRGESDAPSFDALLADVVALAVEAHVTKLTRPTYVTQRTVRALVGLPPRDFLRLARTHAFPSCKEKRLVFAKLADVEGYIASRRRPDLPLQNDGLDEMRAALARVGAR